MGGNRGAPAVVVENIEKVIQVEEALINSRSPLEKFAEDLAGSVGTFQFVLAHLLIAILWVIINAGLIPIIPVFDPFPYSLLSLLTSFEAVLLTAVVLMKQNRMTVIADRREHLDLQVNLLTEREVTHAIHMLHRMSNHLGMPSDDISKEYARVVTVDHLVTALHERMPDAFDSN